MLQRTGGGPCSLIIHLVEDLVNLHGVNLHSCHGAQVEDLARLSFKHQPLYVGVDDGRRQWTGERRIELSPAGMCQGQHKP
eukprot:1157536-Pelagomonas_calceolata.AAC.3